MPAADRLRSGLAAALGAATPGSSAPHVVVSLPSHSMPQRLLDHHASLLVALEHRALLDGLLVGRGPGASVVVITCAAPDPVVLDYYARLARPDDPDEARRRISCLVVPDDGARGISAKLLEHPDLLELLRWRVAASPAVIEPWNVTGDEEAVAVALGVPLHGGPADLWGLGFKSASRRVFREAGVPVPVGVEDVHGAEEVASAVVAMRTQRPRLDRVVVKLDNSGAAEGNWVMPTRDEARRPMSPEALARHLAIHAPAWFREDLRAGGVVEELVTAPDLTSPSAQVQVLPGGEVVVRSTHDQVLGGDDGQVFLGSRFPADPRDAGEVGRRAGAVARVLAGRGAVGWLSVDFVAWGEGHDRQLVAVDLNLRKGGTTHSWAALQHLVPGAYDANRGAWVTDADRTERHYRSGDAVAVPGGPVLSPADAIAAVAAAGLAVDHERGTGVVLHMFPSLERAGIGATAIGRTAAEAQDLFDAVPAALAAR